MEAATELKLLPRCGLSPLRSDPELQPLFDKATELRTASVPAHPWDNVLSLIGQYEGLFQCSKLIYDLRRDRPRASGRLHKAA